jgi:hypothetical protein
MVKGRKEHYAGSVHWFKCPCGFRYDRATEGQIELISKLHFKTCVQVTPDTQAIQVVNRHHISEGKTNAQCIDEALKKENLA